VRHISIANRHPQLRIQPAAVRGMIHALDAHATEIRASAPTGELSLVFLTDTALAKLHADFLADPTITDVITFAGDPAFGTAGEICVSADAAWRHAELPLTGRPLRATARRQAPARQTVFSCELTLYIVHGWLHLAGYDDLEPGKKRAMRRAEARAMKLLGAAGCLPVFQLRSASR
jgi:probable rRNA maturation factor